MTYEDVLRGLMERDERVVLMTAENRAPLRSFRGGLAERIVDTGITEQTLVGAAAGLALCGRRPVAHALAAFLTMRAFEFIRTDIGIAGLPVTLVGYVPGVLSEANGPTHQALEDVALMRMVPGMRIFCPADAEDLALGMAAVVESGVPAYVRYLSRPAVVAHEPFAWGRAEVFSRGRDVALLTYGALFTEAWDAKRRLEEKGVSVRLLNLRSLSPWDDAQVLEAVRDTRLTVTLEDHFLTGGLASLLAETLVRRRMKANVLNLAFEGRWFAPLLLADCLEAEGLTGEWIARRIAFALENEEYHENAT